MDEALLTNLVASKAAVDDAAVLVPPVRVYNYARVKKKSKVGSFSYLSIYSVVEADVVIGNYVSVASECRIGVHPHPTDFLSTHPFQYNKAHFDFVSEYEAHKRVTFEKPTTTHIGNDVWIGAAVTIARGVRVGDGAVIAAHSFVNRDVAPYTIVGGTPARVIKPRFEHVLAQKILSSRWWELLPWWMSDVNFAEPATAVERVLQIRRERQAKLDAWRSRAQSASHERGSDRLFVRCPEGRLAPDALHNLTRLSVVRSNVRQLPAGECQIVSSAFDYARQGFSIQLDGSSPWRDLPFDHGVEVALG